MAKRKLFGEILVESGVLTEETLGKALEHQKGSGRRLGLVLEEMKIISERDIALVLARQFHFKTVSNIAKYPFPPDVLALVDVNTALAKYVFPLKVVDKSLYLAMSNPLDIETIENLTFRSGLEIVPYVTTAAEIHAAVCAHYLKGEQAKTTDQWVVLVAEDSELVRSTVVAAIKKAGYQVLEAANGAEALKIAAQQKPHLVLADIMMPQVGGYEMFRSLQANPATKDIPVIALSARSTPEEEARLLNAGFFDFIPKPLNVVRLLARLKRALRHIYGLQIPPVG